MTPQEKQRAQKPYRMGMILLCFGAFINWISLAEDYTQPIRYAGVACIVFGILLLFTAMCCWLCTSNNTVDINQSIIMMNHNLNNQNSSAIQIISNGNINEPSTTAVLAEKPPDYDVVTAMVIPPPPTYIDALKLNPSILMVQQQNESSSNNNNNNRF